MSIIKIGISHSSEQTVRYAANKLAAFLGGQIITDREWKKQNYVLYVSAAQNSSDNDNNWFRIEQIAGQIIFTGQNSRNVLAGVLYYIHHKRLDHQLELPLQKSNPFRERLVMEDFPFMCYQPTGFDFSLDLYAENLVGLGFTAMECNRFSRYQPMDKYHWNYAFTNPSLAYFVWTKWHEGVWDKSIIEENAKELDLAINTARKFELAPTLTTFLPRPYPKVFFEKHPNLRGPCYQNEYMKITGHEPVYCLNTDLPEVQDFYREIYCQIFDSYPNISHLFFWHSDLGTTFYADNEGPSKRTLFERVGDFQKMIQDLLKQRQMKTKIWFNPWGLDQTRLEQINDCVPKEVNYSIKDNAGLERFVGSSHITLTDATIVSADLGKVALKVIDLAEKSGRDVCLAQYQDFSEDIDPVLSVPHPIMTFRKFRSLIDKNCCCSSVNWGVLSPDVSDINLNQNVMREMVWGNNCKNFTELLKHIIPAGFSYGQVDQIYKAWRCIDNALSIWPQYWGLRLQDSGLRLRWLVRPIVFDFDILTNEQVEYFRSSQIYAYGELNPFKSFLNINTNQAFEIGCLYEDMTNLLAESEKKLSLVQANCNTQLKKWLNHQGKSIKTLRLFWTTYLNIFKFLSLKDFSKTIDFTCKQECIDLIKNEIRNTDETIEHLSRCPETIVIAGNGKWGQCLGVDFLSDFKQKREIMSIYTEC